MFNWNKIWRYWIKNIKKLSSLYGGRIKLPVIIVYTQAIAIVDKKLILDFKYKINNLNIKVILLIANLFFKDEDSFYIPQKDSIKLIEETIQWNY